MVLNIGGVVSRLSVKERLFSMFKLQRIEPSASTSEMWNPADSDDLLNVILSYNR